MLALVLAAILFWSALVAQENADQNDQLFVDTRAEIQQLQLITISENIEMYYQQNNAFPMSLAALSMAPGYEFLKSNLNAWQGYAVSPAIVDGRWTFSRMVVYNNDPSIGVNGAAYLSSNTCGTGGFDTATTAWCGLRTSMYWVKETRDPLNDQIITARLRLNRLTRKFANYYNGKGAYPSVDGSNNSLAPNSIIALSSLVGYAGNATNCTGQFHYLSVPIDCGDMFDLWGGPVGYQFVTNQHIILVSETPVFNSSGSRVVIAADRDRPAGL